MRYSYMHFNKLYTKTSCLLTEDNSYPNEAIKWKNLMFILALGRSWNVQSK